MENQGINLLIKDFYAKYDPDSYSEEKVKSVIDFYKGDHELIIKDFYAKYDPDAYSEEKASQVSDFYGLKKKDFSVSDSPLQEDTTTSAIPSEGRLTTDTTFYRPVVPFEEMIQPSDVSKRAAAALTTTQPFDFKKESQKTTQQATVTNLEERLGRDTAIEDSGDRRLYNDVLSTFLPSAIKGMEDDVVNYLKENPKEADKIRKKEGKISEADKFEILSKVKEQKINGVSEQLNELKGQGVIDLMESQASNYTRLEQMQTKISGLTSQIKEIENKYINKNGFQNINEQLRSLESILADPSKATPELINRYNSLAEQHNQIVEKLGGTEYGQLVEKYKALSGEYNLLAEQTNQITETNKESFDLARNLFGQYEQGVKEYNSLVGYFPKLQEVNARQEAFNATIRSMPAVPRLAYDLAVRSFNSLYDFANTLVFKSGAQIASAIGDVTMPGSYKLSDQYLDWYESKFSEPFAVRTDTYDVDEETGKYKNPVARITGMVGDQVGLFVGLALTGRYMPIGQTSSAAMSTNYATHLNRLNVAAKQAEVARTTVPMFLATFDEHYKQGAEHGFDGAGRLLYGTAMAAIEGASELIMPNYKILFGKGVNRTALQGTVREAVKKNWTLGQIVKSNVHNIMAENAEEMIVEGGEFFTTLIGSLVSDDIDVSVPTTQDILDLVLVTTILTGVGGFGGTIKDAKRTKAYMKLQLAQNSPAAIDTINEFKEQKLISEKQADDLIIEIQKTEYLLGEIPESLSSEKKAAIIEKKTEINTMLSEAIINDSPAIQRMVEKEVKRIDNEIQQIIADPEFDTKYNEQVNQEITDAKESQPEIAQKQKVADRIVEETKAEKPPAVVATKDGFVFHKMGKNTEGVELKTPEEVSNYQEKLVQEQAAKEEIMRQRQEEAAKDNEVKEEFPYRFLGQRFKTKEEFLEGIRNAFRQGSDHLALMGSDNIMQGDATQSEVLKAAEEGYAGRTSELAAAKPEFASYEELQSSERVTNNAMKVLDNIAKYMDNPNQFAEPTEKGAEIEQKQNNARKQQEIKKGVKVTIRRGDGTIDGVVETIGLNPDGSKNFVVKHAEGTDTVNNDDVIAWKADETQTRQAMPTILLPVLFTLSKDLSDVKKGLKNMRSDSMR